MVGVAAVGLGAGGAAGDAAVVAPDEELSGRERVRVEVVKDGADLARPGVDVVFRAVPGQTDGTGAAAEGGELAQESGQLPVRGQATQFGAYGCGVARDDGASPLSDICVRSKGKGLPGAADAWRYRGCPGRPVSACERR